ncbi:MAG: hypothetical protein ThorAB25_00680 [Candidatus Thorarchaeota archaeon AB_25]|nr:MAG: hypothetical protein ThorAB25_00680 [Candidatus Thorarchaeota archaeon AB_25]
MPYYIVVDTDREVHQEVTGKYGPILDDFMDEAIRIEKVADELGIPLRVIGCLAFRIKSPEYTDLHIKMGREVTDIDYVSYYKHRQKLINLFRDDLGYHWVPPSFARASTLRDLFIDQRTGRKIDVFYDHLEFCHKIDFKENKRLEVDQPTIPLAELFLEKTQIVEINAKDLKDLVITFLAHDVNEEDDDNAVNGNYISKILSDDWGFYYTVTENIKKFIDFVPSLNDIDQNQKDLVISKAQKLLQLIEDAPKSRSWNRRAKVGTKKRWYKFVHSMEGTRNAD